MSEKCTPSRKPTPYPVLVPEVFAFASGSWDVFMEKFSLEPRRIGSMNSPAADGPLELELDVVVVVEVFCCAKQVALGKVSRAALKTIERRNMGPPCGFRAC
jgi:hypothetical protein